eukprot:CAMPEP_0197938738 /NCGR_PEP_ID=MMETSP1439-20131203/118614_1 /TAXON_ID=66791 /ORGANISM="Gonyaulax spinifera, Strain CCMP409" /LENGTH=812 /DNA_ID=CAMNT_0043561819 /DNA_START=44 /DNA_END=2483 /DNA_ORIENTATION=+
MAAARLQITVLSAQNLYNSDGFLAGKSDPYCIVEVPGQPQMKFQTNTINNCLDPVWDFTGEIDGFMAGDTLEFQVWDSDTWPKSDQLLGKVALTANDFYPEGLEGELALTESKTTSSLTVRIIVLDTAVEGEPGTPVDQTMIDHTIVDQDADATAGTYAQEFQGEAHAQSMGAPQALHINILNARGLYNADGFLAGKSDPYCICQIPGKPHSKIQTRTMDNTLDPDWNHTGIIQDFEAGDSLEFQVWDSDTFPKPDQLLGQATLSPQDFADHPEGIAGVLELIGGKATETSSLEIVVQLDAHQPDAVQPDATEPAAAEQSAANEAPAAIAAHSTNMTRIDHLNGARMAKLKVTMFSASGLYNSDGFLAGKSDPYCVCFVPEKPSHKFRTKTINNCLSPTWNHLSVLNGFVLGESVEFQVWDSDTKPKPDQLLGKAVLRSDDFIPYGFEGELMLSETKAPNCTISVRIEVFPDTTSTGLSGAVLTGSSKIIGGQIPGGRVMSTTVVPSPMISQYQRLSQVVAPAAVASSSMFDAMDRNHDGVITRSEFNQAAAGVPTKVEYASRLSCTVPAMPVQTMANPTVTYAAPAAEPVAMTTSAGTAPTYTTMRPTYTTVAPAAPAMSYSIPNTLPTPVPTGQDLSASYRLPAKMQGATIAQMPVRYAAAPVTFSAQVGTTAAAPAQTVMAPTSFQSGAIKYAAAAPGGSAPATSYSLPAASRMTLPAAPGTSYTIAASSNATPAVPVMAGAPQIRYAMPMAAFSAVPAAGMQPGNVFDKIDANRDGVIAVPNSMLPLGELAAAAGIGQLPAVELIVPH